MLTDNAPQSSTGLLHGTPVVAGVVYAPVQVVRTDLDPVAVDAFRSGPQPEGDDAIAAYDAAVDKVAAGFLSRSEAAHGSAAEVLAASGKLTRDRGMRTMVQKNLAHGNSLLDAIDAAVSHFGEMFAKMGGLMAERVTDLHDIRKRIIAHLIGVSEPGVPVPDVPSVLVAEDLAPADSAGLQPDLVAALVMEKGGATSHTAIIARQLAIPCIVGVAGALGLPSGQHVLVDGAAGTVDPAADPQSAQSRVAASIAEREAQDQWTGPAKTADGAPVKLLANVADPASAEKATEAPVEGVGLFRTELAFLKSTEEPSVEEQADLYEGVLRPFVDAGATHVVTRTLDAGSDKPIAYATIEGEENPALGVRGYRLAYDKPGLLDHQLDALKIAGERVGIQPWVMAPMIATPDEAREFAKTAHDRGLKAGVMIEIPSAALLADRIIDEVDFLSIGTNDLTQYTMAADRMATDLAHLTDPWQPAVLQLVAMTAAAGKRADKPVGVCGEAASDPLLACVLVGMGITSLSMAAASVRAVGAQLSRVTFDQCLKAAEVTAEMTSPVSAREAARAVLVD